MTTPTTTVADAFMDVHGALERSLNISGNLIDAAQQATNVIADVDRRTNTLANQQVLIEQRVQNVERLATSTVDVLQNGFSDIDLIRDMTLQNTRSLRDIRKQLQTEYIVTTTFVTGLSMATMGIAADIQALRIIGGIVGLIGSLGIALNIAEVDVAATFAQREVAQHPDISAETLVERVRNFILSRRELLGTLNN